MSDARNLPPTSPNGRPLSATSASEQQSAGDELSDNDLDVIVGGLARRMDATSRDTGVKAPSYTVSFTAEHEIVQRASA